MSRGTRILLAVMIGGILLAVGSVGATVAAVYRGGTIAVEVRNDDGGDLSVSVPAGLARLALALVPEAAFDELASELRDVEPFLPAAAAAWRQLEQAPDFVLVDVTDGDETVRVEKRGGRLIIRVDADGESVRVGIPLSIVDPLVERLERRARRRA